MANKSLRVKDKWISIEYEGVNYRSVAACAEAIGIGKGVLYRGFKKKLNIYQIVERHNTHGPSTSIPMEYKGKLYESAVAFCRDHNIHPVTFLNKKKAGESIDHILKTYQPQVVIEWSEEKIKSILLEIYKKFNNGQPCGLSAPDVRQYIVDNNLTSLSREIVKYFGSKPNLDKELGLKKIDRGLSCRASFDQFIIDFKKTWGDPDSEFSKWLKHIGHEGYPFDYSDSEYKNNHTSVKIFCNICKNPFYQLVDSHKKGFCGCKNCIPKYRSFKTQQYTIEDIFRLAIEKHGTDLEYNFEKTKKEYTGYSHSYIYYVCPKHRDNGERKVSCQNHLLNGHGCPSCGSIQGGISNTESLEENIRKSEAKHGKGRYDYSYIKEEDFKTKKDKVKIFCPELDKDGNPHGFFLQTWNNHLSGSGCPKCNTLNNSKAVQLITKILLKNNINFEREKRFPECKNKNPLPFDFLLVDYNILIEFDGIQHFEPMRWYNNHPADPKRAEEKLLQTQANDEIKNNWSKKSPYTLYRIPYNKNVEKELNKILIKNKVI